jgi:mRNA interferase MazF
MTKGTIVLTPFPFTDLSSTKIRPAVVVSSSRKLGNDVIVAFISSKIIEPILETEFLLTNDHPDFKKTRLKKNSVFKMDKIITLETSILVGEIGKVSPSIMKELDKRLKIIFDL